MSFSNELLACLRKLGSENLNDHLIDLKKENFDIIESDEDSYISISYLRKKEYEKVDIQDFLNEAYQRNLLIVCVLPCFRIDLFVDFLTSLDRAEDACLAKLALEQTLLLSVGDEVLHLDRLLGVAGFGYIRDEGDVLVLVGQDDLALEEEIIVKRCLSDEVGRLSSVDDGKVLKLDFISVYPEFLADEDDAVVEIPEIIPSVLDGIVDG